MADQEHIGWLRDRLRASLAIEAQDPSELLEWLEARRKDVPFSAELIPLREVADWQQADNGNICNTTGQFFRIEGVRVRSAPGLREIAGMGPAHFHADGWRCAGAAVPRDGRARRRVPAAGQGRSGQYRLSAILSDHPEHLGKHSRSEGCQAARHSPNASILPTISV